MAKKPFINKYGFVEYPFLHDQRKMGNWWFWNLLDDYLKRRARQKHGHGYTREQMEEDFNSILGNTVLKFFALVPVGMGMEFKMIGFYKTPELTHLEDPVPFITETYGGGKFKVNIYHEGTFAGTENYKTHGEPHWVEIEDPMPY
ncbi:MAG: hypothetical protein G3M78_11405 [Candidatus Nitrohelix vancouverensis]|uniref:Uncharacterized protein n=1 Tax=Candidatus Nitrohelix vancouverensis TaxID=2705534 RepID=A0A7T0C3P5_9BACT|nr:MAG: hypothetical protein G3M78_11405 [Candidatus Nitrohelix vancouverensis]